MEKKKLFSVTGGDNTALDMLKGTKPKQPKEEIKELFQEEVREKDRDDKLQQLDKSVVPKKKSNRGRKRKYEKGEVIKLTALVDKHLSHTLKVVAKDSGTTVKAVMTRYLKQWIEENPKLENSYVKTKNKNYTGFSVTPDLRQRFAEVCDERELTQSYVIEALYEMAINSLKK